MSRAHGGQRPFFPPGNPFWTILHKRSDKSLRIRQLLFSFEQSLAENCQKLKPKDFADVLSLPWMRLAIEILSDAHTSIKTLINELQLPVSDWDEKWIDMYLDSSVKVLDICIALSSELSRLDQGQLLLQYALHLLNTPTSCPSPEKLARARSYLHEWIGHINSKSPKLENCPAIMESLQQTLRLPKVKGTKGKALMRALYGIKVMTLFVCGIFSSILLGCSKPLMGLHISDEFLWFEAFRDLHVSVIEEIKRRFVNGEMALFREIEEVKICALKLHDWSNSVSCKEEPVLDTNAINHEVEAVASASRSDLERDELKDGAADLAVRVNELGHGLDSLSKQTNEFFQIILTGRDALLCNLRAPAVTQESSYSEIKSRSDQLV